MGVGVSKAVLTLYEGMLQSHSSVPVLPGSWGDRSRR